jgi:ribosomal protein S18 acetylase RimI-like enzyme
VDYTIRKIGNKDSEFIKRSLKEKWGSVKVVTRNKLYDASQLPGFIAEQEEQILGFITYRTEGEKVEIITLNSFKERIGVGTSLINAVTKEAASRKVKRIWLITTNDNYPAVKFYQRRGFSVFKIHMDAIEQSRKLKPEIPRFGISGLQIKDEIEMEMFM